MLRLARGKLYAVGGIYGLDYSEFCGRIDAAISATGREGDEEVKTTEQERENARVKVREGFGWEWTLTNRKWAGDLLDDLDEAEARAERLREALEWYAKSENYMHNFERVSGGDPVEGTGNDPSSMLVRMYSHDGKSEAGWRPVVLDAGARARDALAETEKEKP